MNFTDRVTLGDGVRVRDDGYLVASARIARTGVQYYDGLEVGRPDLDMVAVYRPDDEVFRTDTMKSFAHRPVTNDHPSDAVTADNWKEHAVGQTDGDVVRDGDHIRIALMVADGATIDDVRAGKRELSAGYACRLEWTPGTAADGTPYHAIQRDIRANHVAIVDRGRAGSTRIGDAERTSWGASPINRADKETQPMSLRKITVDGLSIETTEQGAEAITKLQTALDAANADLEAQLAEKDAEIATRDASIADLEAKVLTDADVELLVAARADLIGRATKVVADYNSAGKTDADIRREIVVTKLGDAAIDGKSDAYIEARFDVLVEDAAKPTDPIRSQIAGADLKAAPTDNGQAEYVARISDAWKTANQKKDAD